MPTLCTNRLKHDHCMKFWFKKLSIHVSREKLSPHRLRPRRRAALWGHKVIRNKPFMFCSCSPLKETDCLRCLLQAPAIKRRPIGRGWVGNCPATLPTYQRAGIQQSTNPGCGLRETPRIGSPAPPGLPPPREGALHLPKVRHVPQLNEDTQPKSLQHPQPHPTT